MVAEEGGHIGPPLQGGLPIEGWTLEEWPDQGGQAPQREFSGLPECFHYGNGLPIEGWAPQCSIERKTIPEGMGHG